MMRIIAGSARRMQLEVAEGTSTRPFLELARGALFNSLGPAVHGVDVLDLFAGSGALGLEALSRGAARCVFIERDPRAFVALGRNIARCGFGAAARAVCGDAERSLAALRMTFGLIFVDPPFADLAAWTADGSAQPVMSAVARLLQPGGQLIFRLEDKKAQVPDWPGLDAVSDKKYGRSRVCRYTTPAQGANQESEGV